VSPGPAPAETPKKIARVKLCGANGSCWASGTTTAAAAPGGAWLSVVGEDETISSAAYISEAGAQDPSAQASFLAVTEQLLGPEGVTLVRSWLGRRPEPVRFWQAGLAARHRRATNHEEG
jgi:hypothetical protein